MKTGLKTWVQRSLQTKRYLWATLVLKLRSTNIKPLALLPDVATEARQAKAIFEAVSFY